MCQRFNFYACACQYLLKNEEQNFLKKTVITPVFKVRALVTDNKSDLDGDI